MSAKSNTANLMTPFLSGGLKSIKFFNGRLLSGEDLTTEQAASREERERLGLAIGDGVVTGLEVAVTPGAASPTVTVQPGLAINREGDAVNLASPVDVSLYQPASPSAPATTNGIPSPFAQCGPPLGGVYLSSAGVYLLTIAPAYGTQGRALVNGLLDGADACNAKYFVEGVQFRLVQLAFSPGDLADARLRNIVAAKCFGFDVDPLVDPFGPAPAPQGIVEALRPSALGDAEVPIAVLSWTPAGIAFVDIWSVRRRVSRADAADDATLPIHGRDLARGEAILLQFQDQISSMLAGTPTTMVATSAFKYLPPAGLLPLYSASAPGFIQSTFFQGLTVRDPIDIEGARAEALLRTSLQYPPVDITKGALSEMLWTFRTRQNAQSTTAVPYVFFASGQLPFFGESRYNVAYFDFSSWS